MNALARCLVFAIAILLITQVGSAGSNDSVLLTGQTTSEETPHSLTITLKVANTTWTETEPANASNVFKTKSGVWARVNNVVILRTQDSSKRVGQLMDLIPESVPKGKTGKGVSDETATNFDWKVN
jgi:hypothetical protein